MDQAAKLIQKHADEDVESDLAESQVTVVNSRHVDPKPGDIDTPQVNSNEQPENNNLQTRSVRKKFT